MWGFCGCNRRREEREEVSPARDMREFVEVRRPCNECKEDERVMAEMMNEMKEMNEVEPAMTERRGCGCGRNRNRNRNRNMNNSMVSPAESSFCQRQLEAARNSCVVNPLTNFSRCNNNNNM